MAVYHRPTNSVRLHALRLHAEAVHNVRHADDDSSANQSEAHIVCVRHVARAANTHRQSSVKGVAPRARSTVEERAREGSGEGRRGEA